MRDVVEPHSGEILDEIYLPIEAEQAELEESLDDIEKAPPDVIFSTLAGESTRLFCTLYR